MQYQESVKGVPYKIEKFIVPNEFFLDGDNFVVKETMKRSVYLTRDEMIKCVQQLTNKIKFNEFLLSAEHISIVKKEINALTVSLDGYKAILNKKANK